MTHTRKPLYRDQGGQVTIFLVLLLIVLIGVLLYGLEFIRYEQAKGRAHHVTVGAVEHLMADYQVELADWYDLYAIDTNYLGKGKETATHRVWNYLEQNLSSVDRFGRANGLYQMSVIDSQVEPKQFLYENGCHSIKRQIHNWIVEEMIPTNRRVSRRGDSKQGIKKMSLQSGKTVQKTQTVQNDAPRVVPDGVDPRGAMEQIKRGGLLKAAGNSQLPLSKEKKQKNGLPSNTLSWEQSSNQITSHIKHRAELELYLFQHFNSALSVVREEETEYQNELEYIITGKDNDYQCLDTIAMKILLLRVPINVMAIKKDTVKQGEAATASGVICAILMQPELFEEIKEGILMAWAFGESVADVKVLLQGEKVPLKKHSSNWNLSFHELFNIEGASVKGTKEGMDYEDYLKLFLATMSEKKLYMRILDLMQLNIQRKYPEFEIKDCMTEYEITAQIQYDKKYEHSSFQRRTADTFYTKKRGGYQF